MTTGLARRSDMDWVAELSGTVEQRAVALTELRGLLYNGLRRAFRHASCDSAVLEDFAQEALLRISASIHSYRGDSRFLTWAMSIAVRVGLSELRRARWRDVSLDTLVEAGQIPGPGSKTELAQAALSTESDAEKLMHIVHQAIQDELTARQRMAIQAELAGMPPDELARHLGTNRNAVYKLVYDARARLKQAILRAGWSEEQVRGVLDGS